MVLLQEVLDVLEGHLFPVFTLNAAELIDHCLGKQSV